MTTNNKMVKQVLKCYHLLYVSVRLPWYSKSRQDIHILCSILHGIQFQPYWSDGSETQLAHHIEHEMQLPNPNTSSIQVWK